MLLIPSARHQADHVSEYSYTEINTSTHVPYLSAAVVARKREKASSSAKQRDCTPCCASTLSPVNAQNC
jgi:hypothetical protein